MQSAARGPRTFDDLIETSDRGFIFDYKLLPQWIMMLKKLLLVLIIFSIPNSLTAGSLEDAAKYTVRIKTSISNAFAEDSAGTFNGAGFLVDKLNRYIFTNAHVSGHGNANIKIAFEGYDYEEAIAIYVDPVLDLAVLQTKLKDLPEEVIEAKLDCSERDLNGLAVAAYGHPHGLAFSASRGIISKVRTFETNDWVQTDAAINPGNSGGPLIDIETGKIIGVNAMGFEDTQGLNFAVPMRSVCSILSFLKSGVVPSPPAFPISFAANNVLEEHLTVAGNMYGELPEGIQQGDVIIRVGDNEVFTPNDIFEELRAFSGEVNLKLLRGDQLKNVKISVAPQPSVLSRSFILMDGALISKDVYPERWFREGLFQIHSIAQGSKAEQSALKEYQLIVAVNGSRPTSIKHLFELLNTSRENSIIMREWSDRDNFLFDFKQVNFSPHKLELKEVAE